MTDPMSKTLIERLRRKIGDVGPLQNPPQDPAFSDPELQDNWNEAGGNWNKSVLSCYEDLLANTWKFNDYTQNQSQEKKQQIHANLLKLADYWKKKVDDETALASTSRGQVRIMGIRRIPEEIADDPDGGLDDFRLIDAP